GRDLGDVVFDLVEPVADGKLGGDLRNGETCRLRCKRRASRNARVHFHDDHAAVFRVDGELHVRASGIDADFPQATQGGIAHHLIFAICQRLRGRHGDGVARVDAHGVEILDGTDDDGVVGEVAHDLQLEFLPTEDAFLNQDFVDGRQIDAAFQNFDEI